MTAQDYILKEKRVMERECRRRGINPEEWICRFALVYYEKYAHRVLTSSSKAQK